jgi:NitT/TauT family transport system ATP-binding protein
MIQLRHVDLEYGLAEGRTRSVLSAVNLAIGEGEFVCLLGPSGCGKTSLLNLVAGFLKPSSGEVLFNGASVDRPGPDRGVVFQEPTLFPWLSVRDNVAFGTRCRRSFRADVEVRVSEAIRMVGLCGHEHAYPHALSGGMRQRVALARVLVLEPRALLMDEPFSALDANARERLQDEVLALWRKYRRTVLYVTHSVEEAAYLADRVVVMGPAPQSIVQEFSSSAERPRDRSSAEVQGLSRRLREALNGLPCCVGACAGGSLAENDASVRLWLGQTLER